MQTKNPEDMARAVVEACADCDICRYLMESTSCKVFPELYRLFDKEAEKAGRMTPAELKGFPGFEMERIGGAFHCCGIAGIMGFKKDSYQVSIEMGRRLMDRITLIHPERLLTDCLSCRIQFNQLLPYRVYHPVEILCESHLKNRHL
ncbi:MAG: hypothetical protein LLG06_01200 [Desulfobacteraceae bacterium]|nr:hypothetical protein [Desulfobacteraceae bacterium]